MLSNIKHLSNMFIKNKKIVNSVHKNLNPVNNLTTKTADILEEKKINVDGVDINYVRTGRGDHAVLLLPGVMGSIWTDFKPQIENLNKEKLTIIAWDPPGYGKSRPPNRTFPKNYYRRDATWACNLMKTLGYDKFSLLGWSEGGITSLILAAVYPDNVHKIIAIAPHAYLIPAEVQIYESNRDINNWSEKMRVPLIAIYGEKYFQDTVNSWVDAMRTILENNDGDLCKGDVSNVRCPSLIVHGEKDIIIPREHPDYLQANIKNSKVVTFEDGGHNVHLRYADKFNSLVHTFLLDQADSKL